MTIIFLSLLSFKFDFLLLATLIIILLILCRKVKINLVPIIISRYFCSFYKNFCYRFLQSVCRRSNRHKSRHQRASAGHHLRPLCNCLGPPSAHRLRPLCNPQGRKRTGRSRWSSSRNGTSVLFARTMGSRKNGTCRTSSKLRTDWKCKFKLTRKGLPISYIRWDNMDTEPNQIA